MISGRISIILRFALILLITFCALPVSVLATPLEATPIVKMSQERAPEGKSFFISVEFPQQSTPYPNVEVRFDAGNNRTPAKIRSKRKITETEWELEVVVPAIEKIFKSIESKWYEGIIRTRKATLVVKIGNHEFSSIFGVPKHSMAVGWGLAVMVLLLLTAAAWGPNPYKKDERFTEDVREVQWKKKHIFTRFFLYVLNFTVSHRGRYSVSTTQILFWTGLVIFASVYVFVARGDFLVVTDQVLILLGISGGTAIAAKVATQSAPKDWIPLDYFKDLRRVRLPSLRDLISVDDRPNIYKFQMLAFTVINGWIVVSQLFAKYNFPEIPAEQLLLIGISNGTYLGNELSGGNSREMITLAKDDAERKKNTTKFAEAKDKVQCLICKFYGAKKI